MEPVAATQHTAAGAKAFAEFFIKTIDWGFATMSGAYIRHYAASDCLGCRQFADGIDKARREVHRYIGGWFTITGATTRAYSSAATVVVQYNSMSFEEVDQHGRGVSADPAETAQRFRVALTWRGSTWQVKQLLVEQ